jgi:hypothetical protein
VKCTKMKETLRYQRTAVYMARGEEIRAKLEADGEPLSIMQARAPEWDYSMQWPGWSAPTLAAYLWSISHALDYYCKVARRSGEPYPPRPVRMHASVFSKYAFSTPAIP